MTFVKTNKAIQFRYVTIGERFCLRTALYTTKSYVYERQVRNYQFIKESHNSAVTPDRSISIYMEFNTLVFHMRPP